MRPDLSLIGVLWPGALGIALMSFTETVAAGQAFARKDEPAPRANTELLATGLANIGGALLGAMPGGGGTTQTAVNVSAGARTQLAEMVTAAMTLVTISFCPTRRDVAAICVGSAGDCLFLRTYQADRVS